jgi:hypothetical protein
MNWPREALEDNSGGASSIRITMLTWLALVAGLWAYIALRTTSLPDIPPGVLALTAMIVGGKVVQRFGEQPPTTP